MPAFIRKENKCQLEVCDHCANGNNINDPEYEHNDADGEGNLAENVAGLGRTVYASVKLFKILCAAICDAGKDYAENRDIAKCESNNAPCKNAAGADLFFHNVSFLYKYIYRTVT